MRHGWSRSRAHRTAVAGVLGASATVVGVGFPHDDAQAATPFSATVLDAGGSGDCKAAGDLDGDGLVDGVIAGRAFTWFRSPTEANPTPPRIEVARATTEFSTDCELADVDGDGDLDLVVPDERQLRWYRNPRPTADVAGPWAPVAIGTTSTWTHDVEVADLDADGDVDVVARREGAVELWLQQSPASWSRRQVSSQGGEGTAVGDVDGDGDIDIVAGGRWLANPGPAAVSTGTWTSRAIDAIAGGPIPVSNLDWGSVAVADIDGDGRDDVVFGPIEAQGRKLAWYRPLDAGATTWEEHLIAPAPINAGLHGVAVGDVDGDGRADVVTGRMHTYAPSTLSVWTNPGPGGGAWTEQVLATTGMHNLALADFGGDGDLDIFGSNYIGTPPVRLYRNDRLRPPGSTTTAPATTTTVSSTTTTAAPTTTTAPPAPVDQLRVSADPRRSGSQPLAGSALAATGATYIFLTPVDSTLSRVEFWLDDPSMRSSPRQVETLLPYDLAGGSDSSATAVQLASIGAGTHTITARRTRGDGTKLVTSATFTVGGTTTTTPPPPPPTTRPPTTTTTRPPTTTTTAPPATTTTSPPAAGTLRVSSSANRSGSAALQGRSLPAGSRVAIFLEVSGSISSVEFHVDDPGRTKAPRTIERLPPWDLAGGSDTSATLFTVPAAGNHTITAVVRRTNGTVLVTTATYRAT